MSVLKYNLKFSDGAEPLQIELTVIKKWETARERTGTTLSFHYEQARKIIWPELDAHRWHDLCRDEIVNSKICCLVGPGSSGKTHEAAWTSLIDYWANSDDTCVLISSTDIRGLRKRVWGEIVMLWERGVERFTYLTGHLLDSSIAITTDSLEDVEFGLRKARDMRCGIFGVPCVQGGQFVGLQKYQGIKQKRMRLVADEASAMGESFLSAFANLNKNEDFKAIVLGNPQDPLDPLGRAAEPKEGWTDKYLEPGKTMVWDTRFMNGRCVNLIGTDSPNFDHPGKTKYKYLISKEKIDDTLSFFSKDSPEYYSQCVGSMKIGTMARRVLDRNTCEQHNAFDAVLWKGTQRTKICAMDASYGGDRCVIGWIEFGEDSTGHQMLLFHNPTIVPIKVTSELIPEDQIARHVRMYCSDLGIEAGNFFHDSTGRGSLGTALAREWSAACNPVEFGGKPTKRPVSLDMYINDERTKERRLKMCDEHYVKRVTEYWFSVRYAVLSDQVRGFPSEVLEEMSMRKWDRTKNAKIELETKEDMKERVGRSPDMADWAAIAVEGARQRGFQIQKLGKSESVVNDTAWMDGKNDFEEIVKGHLLQHA